VGDHPFVLATSNKTFQFCCEACLGIYRMLNNLEDPPGQTPDGIKSSN
jgi:hypothetical protein